MASSLRSSLKLRSAGAILNALRWSKKFRSLLSCWLVFCGHQQPPPRMTGLVRPAELRNVA